MKQKKYIGLMLAAGMLAAASCSDFKDYNEVKTDSQTASANTTLWENISSNSNLSQFAALVQKAGLSSDLNSPTYYTVWAPVNGSFDYDGYNSLDSATLARELVKNHIAYYGIQTGDSSRVHTLNNKSHIFTPETFSGVDLISINQPGSNGILHTIDGSAPFYPNFYEFIEQCDTTQDSIAKYIMQYHYSYLNESKSVVGPIVNGMQTYTDSVMETGNILLSRFNFKYDNEDSTYTCVLPTNKAWNASYAMLTPYFKYPTTIYYETYDDKDAAVTSQESPASNLQDSLAKRFMLEPAFYSNNNTYNKLIVTENRGAIDDTIYSTRYGRLSHGSEILKAEKIETLSNGYIRYVDSLRYVPWQWFKPGYGTRITARVLRGTQTTVQLYKDDIDETKLTFPKDYASNYYTYTHITPESSSGRPEFDIELPAVLSTTYNFYLIVVPQNIDKTDTIEVKPNKLGVTLSYAMSNGNLATKEYNFGQAFVNDTAKVDTMYLGQFTFPTAYYGLSNARPVLKITNTSKIYGTEKTAYTRDLRIAGVMVLPEDYDAYRKEKGE